MANSPKSIFLRFWFPVLAYSAIIFVASSIPNVQTPLAEFSFDKILHFLEYIPFGFLAARAISGIWPRMSAGRVMLGVLVMTFLYAVSDEVHQTYVSGRDIESWDALADTAGGICGGYLRLIWNKRSKGNHQA